MTKIQKIGCVFVCLSAAAIVALLAAAFIFADVAIEVGGKTLVEKFVPPITGTKVSVGDIKSSIFQGKIKIIDFVIYNPEGYKSSNAFRIGTVAVDADMKSFMTDKIIIKSVLIDDVHVTYEQTLNGSNLNTIKKNVEAFTKKNASAPSPEIPSAGEDKKGRKCVIKTLDIRNGQVFAGVSIIGNVSTGVAIPDIHMENIGEETAGKKALSFGEAFVEIFKVVLNEIAGALGDGALSFGNNVINELQKVPSGVLDNIKNIFK